LLRARRAREGRCTAQSSDEFSPSKANPHLPSRANDAIKNINDFNMLTKFRP
jgi:hypothetical protein